MKMLNPAEGSQTVIPAFIAKLWHMVSDSTSDDLISWGRDGTTFLIKDHNKFSSEMLPMYYKHNNMASFIRQLNMYNFHKVALVESSSLKNQKELEFSHPNFIKGKAQLLNKIQRKITSSKDQSEAKCDPVVFNNLLKEVKQLRTIQEIFSNKLTVMKKENAALWREHSILRQRHAKQEKIVNKVIHFLVSMVQQSSINVTRRKLPLMIKDRPTLKPTHRKKYVRVVNQKSQPVICEIDPQEMLKEVNGQIVGEEVLPEELLLSCTESDGEEEATAGSSNDGRQTNPLIKIKTEIPDTLEVQQDQEQPKRKIRIIKTGKKRKCNETKSSADNFLTDLDETNTLSPASSFAESVPSPEYILIDSGDGIAQLLKVGEEANTNMQNNVPQSPHSQETGNQFTSDPLQLQSNTLNAQGTNYVMHTSPTPIVTSPAQSVPSPPPQTSTNVEAGISESYNSLGNMSSPDNTLLQLAKPADIHDSFNNKEDAEIHLDKVQSDLEILKDLLKGEGISLDANMVLELFNDHPLDLNMGPAGQSSDPHMFQDPSNSGQALISYSPSLLDLEPDLSIEQDELTCPDDVMIPDYELNTPQVRTQSPSFPDSS